MRPHAVGLAAHLTAALALAAALTASPGDARADTLDDTLAEIDRVMAQWAEHRAQTILVQAITGLEAAAAGDSNEQLQLRLKSLLTKKRSNREWKGYWEGEARLAEQLLAAWARAAPTDAAGPVDAAVDAAALALNAAAEASHAADLRRRGVGDAVDAARAALSEALAGLRAETPKIEAEIEARKDELHRVNAPIARLEAAAATGAAAAVARLEAATAARDEASAALAEQRERAARNAQLIAHLEPLLEGDVGPASDPPAEPALATQVATLRDAASKLASAEAEAAAAAIARAEREAQHRRLTTLQTALRARRPALEDWAALARDKMRNQDDYLVALDADIEAIEERLRGVSGEHAGSSRGVSSAATCEAARQSGETPLERFQACEEAIRAELRVLAELFDDTLAADLLNDRQAIALEQVIVAQQRDLDLVVREVRIAGGEEERAQRADETAEWREAWSTYATRARDKQETLAAALQTSKDTGRMLTVSKAFFASERESLARRVASLEARLDERTSVSRFAGALLETAWLFLRNAYMVPIYLLLAWLLLRFARRLTQRVVARAQKETASRDEVQRIETLASVTRGAIQLVVLIATVLLCLSALGVNIGPILGGAAIFGLAISFGSQSLVKDFVTGFFILLENQYAVGDFVNIGGQGGTVEAITMRRTVLRDLSGQVHNIPNGSISSVINTTQGWSRVLIHVGVAYGSDLDKVERVINEEGDRMYADPTWSGRLGEPPRYIGLIRFDDSALTVRIMFKTNIFEQWEAERYFNRRIKDAFEASGIGIPFPQRDVHLYTQQPVAVALPAPEPTDKDATQDAG